MRIERTLSFCLVAAFGLSLLPGCKPESSSVPAKLNTWERSRFEPGGGNAMMCYAIYRTFTNDTAISGSTYRTAGIPRGVDLRRFSRAKHQSLPFADGEFATQLRKSDPALFARIEQSPECLVIQGEVEDPRDLNYLRDCVGVVTFFMEHDD
jgi:hypothetical protein